MAWPCHVTRQQQYSEPRNKQLQSSTDYNIKPEPGYFYRIVTEIDLSV